MERRRPADRKQLLMTQQEEKVPGGKLARLTMEKSGNSTLLQLSGDFFIHPEEGIFLIEESLMGIPENSSEIRVRQTVEDAVKKAGLEMIGIDAEAIARLYIRCRESIVDR